MDKPEALRLADELDQYLYSVPAHPLCTDAAAVLRRLHAENASLSAALASSCDEQRHELWESGGFAGCERARLAERQRDALLEALKVARPYINPNTPYGYHAEVKADAAIKAVEETK